MIFEPMRISKKVIDGDEPGLLQGFLHKVAFVKLYFYTLFQIYYCLQVSSTLVVASNQSSYKRSILAICWMTCGEDAKINLIILV